MCSHLIWKLYSKAGTPLVFGICEMFAERKKRPKNVEWTIEKRVQWYTDFFLWWVSGRYLTSSAPTRLHYVLWQHWSIYCHNVFVIINFRPIIYNPFGFTWIKYRSVSGAFVYLWSRIMVKYVVCACHIN